MITDYNDNLTEIYKHYGQKEQQNKLVEECAELIQAIVKRNTENFIEELADVIVLVDQFLLMNPSLYKKLTELKHIKAQRQVDRIFENKLKAETKR